MSCTWNNISNHYSPHNSPLEVDTFLEELPFKMDVDEDYGPNAFQESTSEIPRLKSSIAFSKDSQLSQTPSQYLESSSIITPPSKNENDSSNNLHQKVSKINNIASSTLSLNDKYKSQYDDDDVELPFSMSPNSEEFTPEADPYYKFEY